jgi:hypothetical protein
MVGLAEMPFEPHVAHVRALSACCLTGNLVVNNLRGPSNEFAHEATDTDDARRPSACRVVEGTDPPAAMINGVASRGPQDADHQYSCSDPAALRAAAGSFGRSSVPYPHGGPQISEAGS